MARKYTKDIPTFISNSVSNFDEVSRWILDYMGNPYIESRHPPGLSAIAVNRWAGKPGPLNNPVYVSREAIVFLEKNVVAYLETISQPERSLFPPEPDLKKELADLLPLTYEMGIVVANYAYSELLPCRKLLLPVLVKGAKWWEKLVMWLIYPILAREIPKALEMTSGPAELKASREAFEKLDEKLSDGRSYLVGDRFTVADVWAAALASPAILPPQFRGNAVEFNDQLPPGYKSTIEELRQTRTGKYVLRMFAEHRDAMQRS